MNTRLLTPAEILIVSGGLDLSSGRPSGNVIDLRGKDKGDWIDANNMCWAPNTPSSSMYPGGANTGPSLSTNPPPPPNTPQDNTRDGDE